MDEEMSLTTERLAVYLWLSLIDSRLPVFISRVYAHDLQSKSLKEIQPQLADAMDSLLHDLAVQDDISINFSSTSNKQQRFRPTSFQKSTNSFQRPSNKSFARPNGNRVNSSKSCFLCKTAGRNFSGHDISNCWHLYSGYTIFS